MVTAIVGFTQSASGKGQAHQMSTSPSWQKEQGSKIIPHEFDTQEAHMCAILLALLPSTFDQCLV